MLKSKDRPVPSPTFMSEEQMGQHSPMSPPSPLPHTPPRPSRLRECTTLAAEGEDAGSPQTPRTAQYLSDLRQTRPARPSGARPPPPSSKVHNLRRTETDIHNDAKTTSEDRPALPTSNSMPVLSTAPKLHQSKTDSNLSWRNMCSAAGPFAGRPLVRPPSTTPSEPNPETEDQSKVQRRSSMYLENGRRWMEQQEAKSLRQALQDMDLEDDRKIHGAAQDEAAELVWKHQNPDAANAPSVFANPDLKDYRSHLRRGSYARNHNGQDTSSSSSSRSASDSSHSSNAPDNKPTCTTRRVTFEKPRKVSPPTGVMSNPKRRESSGGKSYGHLAEAVANDIAIAHWRSSSGSRRILSGEKKMYMHPNDRIWEDPSEEEDAPSRMQKKNVTVEAARGEKPPAPVPAAPVEQPQALPSHVRKNPFARVRAQYEKMERSNSAPTLPTTASTSRVGRHDRVEIQRNPPSQSRNAWYMSNEPLPPTPPSASGHDADEVAPKATPTTDGREIRGDDIRAATSKSRKDYSSGLPRPTVVSDKPGRPIVSFERGWKPKEVVMEEQQSASPSRAESERPKPAKSATFPYMPPQASSRRAPAPQINIEDVGVPPIPTISLPDEHSIPSISLPEDEPQSRGGPAIPSSAPAINVSGPDEVSSPSKGKGSQRPLPSPRPPPRHAATAPIPIGKSTPHYTPSIRQSGALCAHCALPIAGRILSAAGERFHPGCFVCHECNTNLEHVAFYPEPEKQRAERLERIHARQTGAEFVLPEGMTDEQAFHHDGDATRRFYCHLDFHELFSPRCKSCKTPIEGEVIVACGAEWHVGHFFCAQCGDPFDSTMPFVEKDGYAWCVGCHTNRYSPKCRKCKKPVTDVVVKALGADWHSGCFVCMECNGEFADGRYFLRGESSDPVCVQCEERRLKA
ncbi:LIM domain-containing [Lecanosticta acicola]|uniref:LIM domain-containing n=1 Tax=Lecanosticta acicola TaxID=111012 RepID=A0AAI8Z2D6_9PEZI|nr:LIM domain-containing [Lecanosticta acicola]